MEAIPVFGLDVPRKPLTVQIVGRKWEGADSSVSELRVTLVNLLFQEVFSEYSSP